MNKTQKYYTIICVGSTIKKDEENGFRANVLCYFKHYFRRMLHLYLGAGGEVTSSLQTDVREVMLFVNIVH